MKKNILFLSLILIVVTSFYGCKDSKVDSSISGQIIMFNAGSLTMPFDEMKSEFEKLYPGIELLREASGSQAAARKIIDLGKDCDLMASADYKVIDELLIPGYADWNIRFASNQMVLCYTDKSKRSKDINAKNWYNILQEEGIVWGHSDPNLDPCGYRSLMVLQLAEKYYKEEGLNEKLLANRPKENVRPKSVELISLLQTGNMDYAWEYRSVAVQHNLKYIELPDEINLGNYEHDDFYSQAVVPVTGKKPGTTMDMVGGSITYGITLIKDAPNKEAAIAFLKFMLDKKGGLKILDNQGQPPFVPCRVPSEDMKKMLPEQIQKLVTVKN